MSTKTKNQKARKKAVFSGTENQKALKKLILRILAGNKKSA